LILHDAALAADRFAYYGAAMFLFGTGAFLRTLAPRKLGVAIAQRLRLPTAVAVVLGRASPHILRHTATTWLVTKGLPLADVGEWVGMSDEMVSRVYGHLAPERMLRARSAIDAR
jgi:integrase